MEEQLSNLKNAGRRKNYGRTGVRISHGPDTAEEAEAASYEVAETERVNLEYDKRMVRIVVDSSEGDKVNVQLPVTAIRQSLKVTGKLPAVSESLQGIELTEILDTVVDCLDAEAIGDIVNVESKNGDT